MKVTSEPIKSGLEFSRYYRSFTAYIKCLDSDSGNGKIIVISQTGYQMILLATNEVNVDIDGFNTNLKQDDPNYFCVAKKQDYIIVPNSCHIFEQDRYTYHMKNPLTLRIQINIISLQIPI